MKRKYKILFGLIVLFLAGCEDLTISPTATIPATSSPVPATPSPILPAFTPTLAGSPIPAVSTLPISTSLAPTPTSSPTPTPTIIPTPTLPEISLSPLANDLQPTAPDGSSIRLYAISGSSFRYQRAVEALKGESHFSLADFGAYSIANSAAAINATLAPFGYQVKINASGSANNATANLSLLRNEKMLLAGIDPDIEISTNRSKSDFVMVVRQAAPDSHYLVNVFMVRKDSIKQLVNENGLWHMEALPRFIGDDLIYATAHVENEFKPNRVDVNVVSNGLVIYQTITGYSDTPVYAIQTYQDFHGDHWAIELQNQVIIDGKPVNEQFDYQKSYNLRVLGGRPVFIFEKNGQAGLNLGGREVLLPGETVPHYICCEFGVTDPIATGNNLGFLLDSKGKITMYAEVFVP